MAKLNKAVSFTLIALLVICATIFFGFWGFVSSVRSQRTCEWANIDNIEMHAHVDIPRVTSWDCNYEKEANTKKAFFTINQNNFDLQKYVKMYKLNPLVSVAEFEANNFLNLRTDSLKAADFFYKKGSEGGEKWDVLLEKNTGKLWVTIHYKD